MAACKSNLSVFLVSFAIRWAIVVADPGCLQDFCVADLTSELRVNGYPCKDPKTVVPDDFFTAMLANPGVINATSLVCVAAANVQKVPGFNTLSLALGRVDYAVHGVNGFHTHPRASEVVFVLEGEIEVGFITTANVLMAKQIKKGDIFIFPRGLMHYQKNIGSVPASVIAAFDSQLPGTQAVAPSVFASRPLVTPDVTAKAFRMDLPVVQDVVNKFAPKKK